MTTMEMEQRKGALQEIIAQLSSEEEVAKVEKFLRKFIQKKNVPCQYTVEELKERIEAAEQKIQQGKFYTQEEIQAHFERKYNQAL